MIKQCLYSIVRFLPDRAAGVKAKVDKTDNDDDDDKQDGDGEEDGLYRDGEEDDDEPEGDDDEDGQSGASIKLEPKSQACLKSLNLAVVYVDAVLVLSHFVGNQKNKSIDVNINIRVLRLPYPRKDEPMLSWKSLLNNDRYFPGKPSPSAKEIIEFLKSRSDDDNQTSSQNMTDHQKPSKKVQKSSKSPVSTEVSPESVTAELGDLRCNIRDLDLDMDTFTTKINKAVDSLTEMEFSDMTSMKYIHSIIRDLKSAKCLYPDKLEMSWEIWRLCHSLVMKDTHCNTMINRGNQSR